MCSEAYLQGWPLTNWQTIQRASVLIWVMWLCWKWLLLWSLELGSAPHRGGGACVHNHHKTLCSRPQRSFPDCKSAPSCWGRNYTVTWRGPEGTALGFLVIWPVFPFPFASFVSQPVTDKLTHFVSRVKNLSGHLHFPPITARCGDTAGEEFCFLVPWHSGLTQYHTPCVHGRHQQCGQ